ncbi:hypothetical protein C3F00_032900 [Pseudomonas sp. MWU13-2860]|nr:hypothetical protein C3F00_032900 [Pseudomonas sp. MWU13-2860]
MMGGINIHSYAPNPLEWVDPLGLAKKKHSQNPKDKNKPCDCNESDPCPGQKKTRMRHYTSNSGAAGIKTAGAIIPRDQNKIFSVPAKRKPLSPRDAESAYGIKPGKGNNHIDFDACLGEFSERFNPVMKITEHIHTGPIKLEGRNPTFNRN